MSGQDEPHSLEHIHASELYPKRKLISEDKSLQVPFPLLSGESVEYLGRTVDGVIALSNFRLLVRFKDSFVNVPLGLVEQIEMRDIFYLNIYCKDATVVRCAFCTNDACLEWFKRLTLGAASPKKMEDIFAFAFHAWCVDHNPCPSDMESCYQLCQDDDVFQYSFGKEVQRMQFDLKNAWRICYANEDFKLCPSYPKQHIVPTRITDENLKNVANFRALHRFPSVVWRDQRNGAVITRCSQPELGWLGWRNEFDEALLKTIPLACALNPGHDNLYNYEKEDGPGDPPLNGVEAASGDEDHTKPAVQPKKMLIIDARSYGAAFANRAKGGGCECPEYYPSCEIQFMNLPNIHSIRKSFHALRLLCAGGPEQANWLSSMENTKWLHNIAAILKATYVVVNAVDKETRPVLVHCSDGWDRTSQIVALSELLLDPYYRTMEGFQVLVEREWLGYGHKFADRCGQSVNSDDTSERCPVFMQWLDCVHQVLKQFPCAFEFNEAYLVKMVQHTYSCLFGTFLCNSVREREEERIKEKTASVWSLLKPQNKRFYNYLYCITSEQVLRPSCHIRNMLLWSAVYLSNNSSSMCPEDPVNPVEEAPTPDAKVEVTGLQKTRSCDDIVAALEHSANSNRRLSDTTIGLDHTAPLEHLALQHLDNDNNGKTLSEPIINGMANGHFNDLDGAAVVETTSLDDNISAVDDKGVNCGMTNGCMANGTENGHVVAGEENEEDEDSDIRVLVKESVDSVIDLEIASVMNGQGEDMGNHDPYVPTSAVSTQTHDKHSNGESPTCDSNLQTVKSSSTKTLTGSLTSLDQVPHALGLESSTDTIVEDDESKSKRKTSAVAMQVNGISAQNGIVENSIHKENEQKSPINRLKSLESSTSISTSTTDISDSHVHLPNSCDTTLAVVNGDSGNFQDTLLSMKLPFRTTPGLALKLNCSCDIPFSNGASRTSNPSQGSAPSTPFSSRSSTCPPTPGAESSGKLSDSPLQRQMSGLGRHLDTDGLTTFNDPAQVRMLQLEMEYQQRMESMERQLQLMRMAFQQCGLVQNGNGHCLNEAKDDLLLQPESGGSEFHSLGNYSNAASDVSWEQVDEKDSNMTMWIPDHAVTHCAGCEGAFWMAKRKHHCRNCGKIFCSDCSSNYVPIPQQQLKDPARVCNGCYGLMRVEGSLKLNLLPEHYLVLERQQMAAAASH